MAYNAKLIFHFLLLLGFLFFFLNGLYIALTKRADVPFSRRAELEGKEAVLAGIVSMIFGLWCLYGFIAILNINTDMFFYNILKSL